MSASPGLALVRPPAASLADGITTFIERTAVDLDLARRQWHRYVQVLSEHGWTIDEVAPDHACPDSVFIEDTAVVKRGVALVCNPGAASRRPEVAPVAARLESLGLEVHRVEGPAANLDGGDVLAVGDDLYVGVGARTNRAGAERLADVFGRVGYRVHPVPCEAALHLKSAVTALPDGTVIGWPPVTPTEGLPVVLAMPEEAGAHVVDLGGGRLLISASAPRSIELIEQRGYTAVPVDLSEFDKLEGCVTCLSIRVRADRSPD